MPACWDLFEHYSLNRPALRPEGAQGQPRSYRHQLNCPRAVTRSTNQSTQAHSYLFDCENVRVRTPVILDVFWGYASTGLTGVPIESLDVKQCPPSPTVQKETGLFRPRAPLSHLNVWTASQGHIGIDSQIAVSPRSRATHRAFISVYLSTEAGAFIRARRSRRVQEALLYCK